MSDDSDTVQVTVTKHEEKLLQALRSEPNRVAMWVSRGDPMRNHKDLLDMYSTLLNFLALHKIEYWMEYGSVLGYQRHGGMIPWEWDMDIGLTTPHFLRLKELGDEYEKVNERWGFKYYSGPDYDAPAYCFYDKRNDNNLCDIAEYLDVDDKLVCAVEEWHYPSHVRSEILPPQRVLMLGQVALVPAKSKRFLEKSESILGQCTGDEDAANHGRNTIPYSQYDPIPFLLCHMFHPEFIQKAVHPPVLETPVAASIREGFEKFAPLGLPFIVKGVKAFDLDYDAFKARAVAEGAALTGFGWNKFLKAVCDVPLGEALAEWEQGKLAINFLDSPVPKFVPTAGIHPDLLAAGICEDNLMLMLTNAGKYTPFHQDPIITPEGVRARARSCDRWFILLYRVLQASRVPPGMGGPRLRPGKCVRISFSQLGSRISIVLAGFERRGCVRVVWCGRCSTFTDAYRTVCKRC